MKYIYGILIIALITVLVILIVQLHNLSKNIEAISAKTKSITDNIDSTKSKIDYINKVKNKTFIDEILLTILLFKDSFKEIRKQKSPKPVSAIVKAYTKDTKNRTYKQLPKKLAQFK